MTRHLMPLPAVGLTVAMVFAISASVALRADESRLSLRESASASPEERNQQQRERLSALPHRLAYAVKRLLNEAQTTEWLTIYGTPLKALAYGEPLSREQLTTLWDEADRLEKSLLKKRAREFRLAVYETFRQERSEYDRWIAAARQIERGWRDAGKRVEDHRPFIEWLEMATANLRTTRELPTLPAFAVAKKLEVIKPLFATERPSPARGSADAVMERTPHHASGQPRIGSRTGVAAIDLTKARSDFDPIPSTPSVVPKSSEPLRVDPSITVSRPASRASPAV